MTSPISAPNTTDPGDDIARRFRYQHAYGVILWVAAFRRELKYVAIWCEQHEDFMCERSDEGFDAYQIKTREAELGYWEFSDDPLIKSIVRFVKLDEQFPGQIRQFYFISNARCNDSTETKRQHLCPVPVLTAIAGKPPLPEYCEGALKFLADKTSCTREALLAVLKRTTIQTSPSLTDIDDAVRQSHLAAVDGLSTYSSTQLTTLFDRLLSRVRDASSLVSRDPARHYPILIDGVVQDPQLANKRVLVSDLATHLEYLKLLSDPAARSPELQASTRADASGGSQMSRLIARYRTEAANDQKVRLMVERLKHWHERPDGDVIGLEEKLLQGKRPDLIDFAMLAKERFARALARHEYSPAAQEIYAYLLAQVWVIFSELIYSRIAQGASPEAVNLALVNDVYPRVEKLLEDNPLGIDVAEIKGMLFWLTGNCHIKWTSNANIQSSV